MVTAKQLLFVTGLVFVVVVLGASMAVADVVTATAIPYHSDDGNYYSYPPGAVENLIDGSSSTFGILYDDTSRPSSPITGYMVFDFGSAKNIGGAELQSRVNGDQLFPKNATFFCFDDDNAHAFTSSADIASDSHVVTVWSGDLPDLVAGAYVDLTFNSPVLSHRYLGLRLNDGWNTSDWSSDATNCCNQMSEISFASAVPEPSTVVLLASGLMGLLAYAWRKRR